MISYIPNFKNLEWSHKLSLDIADDLQNSNGDMRLVVPMFGSGKSTICLGMMDSKEVWCMGSWDQINNKIEKLEVLKGNKKNKKGINITNHDSHRVVGKLRWLGLKNEDGEIVEQDGFVPDKTKFFDESMGNKGLLRDRDISQERKHFFNKVGRDKLIEQIEAYGIEVVWKYYNDEPIIESYRDHVSDEVLQNNRIFTTTEMIPMLTERNLCDEIIIDEGIEGEKIEFGSLGERSMTLRTLNMSSNSSQVRTSLLTTDRDRDIELFIDSMRAQMNKLYDHIESSTADFVFDGEEEKYGKIAVDLKKVLDSSEMNRLCKDWKTKSKRKDMKTYMNTEMYEKGAMHKMWDIQQSIDIIEWMYNAWKYSEKIEVNRDGYEVRAAKGVYPKYQNLIDWCTKYPKATVTILQTVADRDLPEIYEKMFGMENKGLLNQGLRLDIIDSGLGIEKNAMIQKPFKRFSWNGGSLTKQDMETSLFRDAMMPMMDMLGEHVDVGVILPKNARGEDEMVYPNEFDNALSGNFTIDGTNEFKDVKYLFVCSQRRINPSKMHQPLIDWYLEFEKVENISDYIKTNNSNEQIGYTETDIDWDFDFPDDYNPLDKIWQNLSVKNTVEKLFRRRDPWTSVGETIRLGNNVEFRGNKITSTRGDQLDMVKYLLDKMLDEGMSQVEMAEFLSDLDMNTHATNKVWEVIEDMDITLPLEKKRHGDSRYLTVSKKEVFIDKAVELGYDSLGRTQEVDVPEVCSETGISKSTVHDWISDEDHDIHNYFEIEKGSSRWNPTTLTPKSTAHLMSDKVDSDTVRDRNSGSERRDPFS